MTSKSVHLAETDFALTRLNERAVLLRPRQPPNNELALPRLGQLLQERTIAGLTDVIATGTELCLICDADPETILPRLTNLDLSIAADLLGGRQVHLPVCFDTDGYANDWDEVCEQTGLDRETYVDRLREADLRVAMFGFLPGFTYLVGLPTELRCRRKTNPVARVPAGSVAVGGPYAGIYSLSSPAGWQVIGRTPQPLGDPAQAPPVRLRIGDRLHFQPVSRQDFESA